VTSRRVEVLKECSLKGIPTVVWFSPLLPYINDTEENVRGILDMCFSAGVKGIVCFGMGVTLRDGEREYFYHALNRNFPSLREQYEKKYGNRYEVISADNERLMKLFRDECTAHGVMSDPDECFSYLREFPESIDQFSLY